MNPSHKDFWFVPLGGCGEIGMNLNLYGHSESWLMVDCGVTFENDSSSGGGGNLVEMPDPMFIANRSQALVGMVVTHAHEDHIGAIAHLWDQLKCPIYTTRFTREVLLIKFLERGIKPPIILVAPGEQIIMGPFQVTWVPMTHSTPETNGLLIETEVGRVFHTADWKVDSAPVCGESFDSKHMESLGALGIDAIICDSTNALQSGSSESEATLFNGLLSVIEDAPGRVVVACFSSNVARLQTIGNVAHVTGRFLGLLGRSLQNMHLCAKKAGYLNENFNCIESAHLGYLPPNEVLAIATGSQGDVGAALMRLASDTHPNLSLARGDRVVFSSKTIPGNEEAVERLVEALENLGVIVIQAEYKSMPLHASGHPCVEELTHMYSSVKPSISIPVHGEEKHMTRNNRIASNAGVRTQLQGRNGDLFDIVHAKVRRKAVPVGRLRLNKHNGSLEQVSA
ncbi:MAG: ribonuclease J [Gammaproteobacteria bacterium]|nr:ribonuclease J [Gammaproteobacteria bacterium]